MKSQKLFSEDDVLQLVEQLKAEADAAIDKAYDEGYKACMLEYAPQLEAQKLKYDFLLEENKRLKGQSWKTPLFTVAGTSIGFITGFAIKGIIDTGGF